MDKVLDAVWDYEIAKVDYSARKFIQAATEEQDVAGYSEVIDDLYAAVDTIEKETGLPLDAGNPKGWAQLTDKVAVRSLEASNHKHWHWALLVLMLKWS